MGKMVRKEGLLSLARLPISPLALIDFAYYTSLMVILQSADEIFFELYAFLSKKGKKRDSE